jgi:DHA2 family multidrug resistance protein
VTLAATYGSEPMPNRAMVSVSLMLATVMTTLDTTIANVALPHMAGSVSASTDQISWVLTSYIIATAIVTPLSGWLAGRFGRKQVFLLAVLGFTLASALCGAAQSLGQIVAFRVLQGACGAVMMPLSQSVMLDAYTLAERGPIMALWSMGVMVAPIAGPVLGGWLTDNYTWRWVFYINLPVGALCLIGVSVFLEEKRLQARKSFDVTGFAILAVTLAAFQLFLDRGQSNDWLQSREILIEALVAGVGVYLFVVHTLTTDHPFLPIELIYDRNFVTACIISFAVGLLFFSVLALLPPMTQTLLGYPVMTAGLVTAPRGVASLVSMFVAGRLVGRVDTRFLIMSGLAMFAISFWGMSNFSLQMDSSAIVTTGFVQGLGTGLVFMPLTTLAFATLPPALRGDGTGVQALVRSLGNSIGISIMETVFFQNTQVVHERLASGLSPDSPVTGPLLADPATLGAVEGEVSRQAAMVSYVDVFHMMFVMTVVAVPMVLLLKKPSDQIIRPAAAPAE